MEEEREKESNLLSARGTVKIGIGVSQGISPEPEQKSQDQVSPWLLRRSSDTGIADNANGKSGGKT